MPNRLLFASIHSYLEPSRGAALCTREVLEILAARDWDCRALTCGVLDYANDTPLEDVLASMERPIRALQPHSRAAATPRYSISRWVACASRSCRQPIAAPTSHRARARQPSFWIWRTKCWNASSPKYC